MYLCQNKILEMHSVDSNSTLTTEELWDLFVNKNAFFPLKYKTYCFFRSKGYPPHSHHSISSKRRLTFAFFDRFFIRSALNYGLDYSLYRYHPSLCHAEMCLFVVNGLTADSHSSLSWKHISCLTRLLPVSVHF
jgi:tRNA splicing endonuclease